MIAFGVEQRSSINISSSLPTILLPPSRRPITNDASDSCWSTHTKPEINYTLREKKKKKQGTEAFLVLFYLLIPNWEVAQAHLLASGPGRPAVTGSSLTHTGPTSAGTSAAAALPRLFCLKTFIQGKTPACWNMVSVLLSVELRCFAGSSQRRQVGV